MLVFMLCTEFKDDGAKVLCIVPSASPRHRILFQATLRTLAAHGLQVTVISTDSRKASLKCPVMYAVANRDTHCLGRNSAIVCYVRQKRNCAQSGVECTINSHVYKRFPTYAVITYQKIRCKSGLSMHVVNCTYKTVQLKSKPQCTVT